MDLNTQKSRLMDLAKGSGNIPTVEPTIEPSPEKPITDTPLNNQPMMEDSTEKFKAIMSAGLYAATQAHVFHLLQKSSGVFLFYQIYYLLLHHENVNSE